MNPDFTLSIYQKFLTTLQNEGFAFHPFCEFLERPAGRAVILRHDVDKLPGNALHMAQLEHRLGIRGSYYFRVVKGSWDEGIIGKIAAMGHETGYHYEDLSLCKGNKEEAIRHFEHQLERFRKLCPVKTICMHGSPLSKHDNRDLWKHYDYRNYGIAGEPYFDLDFSRVFYLTDTGRRWDGQRYSVRDKIITPGHTSAQTRDNPPVKSRENPPVETHGRASLQEQNPTYSSTNDIIAAINNNTLPHPLMITIHPQRWTNRPLPWLRELVWQNVKNVIKAHHVRSQHRRTFKNHE